MSKSKKPSHQKQAISPNLTQRRRPILKAALRENLLRRKQGVQTSPDEAHEDENRSFIDHQQDLTDDCPQKPKPLS
jgi:hypothetical protein